MLSATLPCKNLKALFGKSGCSDEPPMAAPRNIDEGPVSKTVEFPSKYVKVEKKVPFGQIQSFNKEKMAAEGGARHRRSFSGAIKRLSTTKSSSSSSSSSSGNSNGSHESCLLKRSGSVSSDVENSIQSAIAHCKRSQQEFQSRKTASEVGFYSLAASRVVCEDQERPGLFHNFVEWASSFDSVQHSEICRAVLYCLPLEHI